MSWVALYLHFNHLFKKRSIIANLRPSWKISLGPILRVLFPYHIWSLFSLLHKGAPNNHGWMEVGLKFLMAVFWAIREGKLIFDWVTSGLSGTRLCACFTLWDVGHGAWLLESADIARGGNDRSLLSVASLQGPWVCPAWQKAFPLDYFGLAFLGTSVLMTLIHYLEKWSTAQLAVWLPWCESFLSYLCHFFFHFADLFRFPFLLLENHCVGGNLSP